MVKRYDSGYIDGELRDVATGKFIQCAEHLVLASDYDQLEGLLRRIQKDGYDPLWRIAEDVTEAIGPPPDTFDGSVTNEYPSAHNSQADTQQEDLVHRACNTFESITVAATLEIAKDLAHHGVSFTRELGPQQIKCIRCDHLESVILEIANGFLPDGTYVGRPLYAMAPELCSQSDGGAEHG